MTNEQVRDAVLRNLRAIAPDADPAAVDPDEDVRDALDLDSMDVLRFVQALHAELGVPIPEADYPKLTTVRGASDYLAARLVAA